MLNMSSILTPPNESPPLVSIACMNSMHMFSIPTAPIPRAPSWRVVRACIITWGVNARARGGGGVVVLRRVWYCLPNKQLYITTYRCSIRNAGGYCNNPLEGWNVCLKLERCQNTVTVHKLRTNAKVSSPSKAPSPSPQDIGYSKDEANLGFEGRQEAVKPSSSLVPGQVADSLQKGGR